MIIFLLCTKKGAKLKQILKGFNKGAFESIR